MCVASAGISSVLSGFEEARLPAPRCVGRNACLALQVWRGSERCSLCGLDLVSMLQKGGTELFFLLPGEAATLLFFQQFCQQLQ